MQRVRTILIMVLFLGAAISQAMPITYQGQLKQSGMPHTGTPDMEFRLYNSLTGGNEIGPTISLPDVPVEDGLFQVVLDFGVVYNGTRWLQVTVEGTALSPRQLITRAPMAINALEVGGLEPGASCSTGGQCASGLCSGGVCETASCSDGLLNGDETDVDCGGPTCIGCSSGNMCLINSDCQSDTCELGLCT